MPKMELIIIRHGETDWNRERVFRGREDVALNVNGIAMADLTAEALKDKVLEAIYTSPLKRAVVTAKRIAMPHQMDVRVKWDFIDIDYGTWAGRSEGEVKEKWARDLVRWQEKPDTMRFLRGESMKKAWKRVNSGLRELIFTHGTGSVIIVSHRIPVKMMTAYLLDKKPRDIVDIRHDPCAMSVFEFQDRKPTPIVLNDSRHLARLGLGEAPDF